MPNRIIKEAICTSEEIDMLSAEEEVFFYRLMVVADDFGIMDARPAIIKARCYPLKSIDISSIQAMLGRLHDIGLIQIYNAGGKPYLHFTNWAKHQQIRAKRAKYPTIDEADEIIGNHLISNAPVIQSNPIQSESNPKAQDKPARFDAAGIELPDCIPRQAWVEWIDYRKKRKLTVSEITVRKQVAALEEWSREGCSPSEIITSSILNGWQGLFKPKAGPSSSQGPRQKDPRFHFDTPEYRAQIAAQSEKYRGNYTPEQLAAADEGF